jgi:DeoR family transcriptional regulator of aga operon
MGKGESRRIPEQRRVELLELVRRRGVATVEEISAELEVSSSTVRRDLERLGREGALRRAHGGARAVEGTTFEPLFRDRRRYNVREKERIGRFAATLIEPGQSVIFDSSSTVLGAVEELERRRVPITAVTNDVGIASALADLSEVEVVVPGGEIRAGSFTLLGSHTVSFLGRLHADVALVGVHAITDGMLSDTSLSVAEAKRAMIGAARRTVLLADHSKFGPPAFFEVARIDAVQDLVTDERTPGSLLGAVRSSGGTRVHVV